jgi:hypothetical protein
MSDLKPYLVKIYGINHTVLLSDEDAAKRGLTESVSVQGAAPVANKMRTPVSPQRSRKGTRDDASVVADKVDAADD